MTYLCYTLDEAAQKLGMSETVLVRLSQFFKVPEGAYEQQGYLSFKGDLVFTDHDISFFAQVRDQVLEGESLEQVKQRLRGPETQLEDVPAEETEKPEKTQYHAYVDALREEYQDTGDDGLVEHIDAAPYEEVAHKNFERYKGVNYREEKPVFQKIAKEMTEISQPEPVAEASPVIQATEKIPPVIQQTEPLPPPPAPPEKKPEPEEEKVVSEEEFDWRGFIQSATATSYPMENHLRHAAEAIRNQALQQYEKKRRAL